LEGLILLKCPQIPNILQIQDNTYQSPNYIFYRNRKKNNSEIYIGNTKDQEQ
jgi:hypothetical protein